MSGTKKHLTDKLARMAAPKRSEYTILDATLQGFALRIQPSGAKTWTLRLRIDGKVRRFSIGSAETMSADEARTRALQLRAEHQPVVIAKLATANKPGITFSELARHLLEARSDVWKPSTMKAVKTYFRAELLPAFGERPINRLTTAEIATWFHDYSQRKPGGANQALTHLRIALKFARDTGRLPRNAPDPSRPIRKNTRRARGRLLSRDQLAKLGAWLQAPQLRWLDAADAIHLILLTGCRAGEIARLTWAEVQNDRLHLKTAKTGARDVILTPPAWAILARRRSGTISKFVFPLSTDPARHIGELDTRWRTIRRHIGFASDIRLHDLRHTYASQAIMSGETLAMAGQLLGHRRPETTEIYAHLDAPHLADAADRVSAIIAKWLQSEENA